MVLVKTQMLQDHLYAKKNGYSSAYMSRVLGLRNWKKPQQQISNHVGFVLTRSSGQDVRSLKSLRAMHTHLPIIRCTGADDGNSPVSGTIRECVLDRGRDFPANDRITRILKLDVHWHLMGIIAK